MSWKIQLLTFNFLILLVAGAAADIYRYVDADGIVHFTNDPPTKKFKLYRRETIAIKPGSAGPAIPSSLGNIIRHYSEKYSLEEGLVHAVIKAESNYNATAVSKKGALGMMQLMPGTARLLKVDNPLDPAENIGGGSRYLRQMLDEFNGNLDFAIAAYNAGPNAVKRHGGIPPYEETRTYVKRVKQYLSTYRQGGTNL
ncbi:MAG: lytic transglycosylase [Deltaproteobacteria bacterium HGW-Deltaproteobacteria-4]|nr:MAG: lytic transglycosylase [Deltaproteobacteria bacterium HGW-Deltaproteobacteria-4]